MRLVAAVMVALTLLAAMPAVEAADECTTNQAAGRACQRVEVPNADPRVPQQVPGIYYIYASPTKCINPLSSDCRGAPGGPGSTVGVFGTVYKETNALPGLQRSAINVDGRFFPADAIVIL